MSYDENRISDIIDGGIIKKEETMSKEKPILNQIIIDMNDRLLKLVQSRDHAREIENFDQVQIKNTHIFIYEKIIEEVLLPRLSENERQYKDNFISGLKHIGREITSNEDSMSNKQLPIELVEKMRNCFFSNQNDTPFFERYAQIAVDYAEEKQKWNDVNNQLPKEGIPVNGFNELWIDEDFNPKGVRECFVDDGGNWTYSKYCNYHDSWHTRTKEDHGKEGYLPPTHWIDLPNTQLLIKKYQDGKQE